MQFGDRRGVLGVAQPCARALQPRLCCTVRPRSVSTGAVTGCRLSRGGVAWQRVKRGEPPVFDASAPKRSSSGTAPPSEWSRSESAPRPHAPRTGVGVAARPSRTNSGTAPPLWSMPGIGSPRHAMIERVVYRLSIGAQGRGGGGRRRAPRRGAAAGGVVGVATLWASEPMPRTTLTSNVVPRRRLSSPPLCRTGSRPAVHPGEW